MISTRRWYWWCPCMDPFTHHIIFFIHQDNMWLTMSMPIKVLRCHNELPRPSWLRAHRSFCERKHRCRAGRNRGRPSSTGFYSPAINLRMKPLGLSCRKVFLCRILKCRHWNLTDKQTNCFCRTGDRSNPCWKTTNIDWSPSQQFIFFRLFCSLQRTNLVWL